MEIAIQFPAHSRKATTIQVVPYRLGYRHKAHIREMIVEHQFEVFVDGIESYGIKGWQYRSKHRVISMTGNGMMIIGTDSFLILLVIILQGYDDHWCVEHHLSPRPLFGQLLLGLESLTQVGSNAHTASHGIRHIDYLIL